MGKRKLSVSSEREVYTYGFLYSAATWSLEQAERSEEGRFYNCLSSIILSAFCLEGYFNHVGSIILTYWDEDFKRNLSINNKLKIICHHLEITPDYSSRPFQSFKNIVKYRNLLAHAITEKISEKGIHLVNDGEYMKQPKTWWEKHTDLKHAKQWLSDTEAIIDIIIEAADENNILPVGILSIGQSHGTLLKRNS